MKLNTTILIATPVLLIGLFFDQTQLWIPISVLVTGTIDLFTRSWVTSNRLGSVVYLSAALKLFFSFVGFYAMIGQFVCLGLLVWWVIA